jgi:SOS response regulatory protein OraA/RecX
VDQVIDRLLALKLLDDLNFSTGFASYRLREMHQGPLRIRMELLQRGVAEETISKALEAAEAEFSVEESALKAAEKLVRIKGRSIGPKEHRRIFGRLSRAGFSAEVIRKALRQLGADDVDWSQE